MYYLRDGFRSPVLAWIFALVAAVAALTTTPFTQPNSMALVLHTVFGIRPLVSGIVIAVLTWLVIIGGISSIGRAAEKLSPLKVGLYLVGGLIVILFNASRIPAVLSLVVSGGVHHALGARASGCSWRCATASRAASTRTKRATGRPPSPTAPRAAPSRRCRA